MIGIVLSWLHFKTKLPGDEIKLTDTCFSSPGKWKNEKCKQLILFTLQKVCTTHQGNGDIESELTIYTYI